MLQSVIGYQEAANSLKSSKRGSKSVHYRLMNNDLLGERHKINN